MRINRVDDQTFPEIPSQALSAKSDWNWETSRRASIEKVETERGEVLSGARRATVTHFPLWGIFPALKARPYDPRHHVFPTAWYCAIIGHRPPTNQSQDCAFVRSRTCHLQDVIWLAASMPFCHLSCTPPFCGKSCMPIRTTRGSCRPQVAPPIPGADKRKAGSGEQF